MILPQVFLAWSTCACLKNHNYIVITTNCANWLSNYDVGMQADIEREKEINTLRQCVFPFRSKKVCTLFLSHSVNIQSSALWSEQDFGPGGPGSTPRWGILCFFWKVVFYVFFFNYGEIYRHSTPTSCLQHRCMDAVFIQIKMFLKIKKLYVDLYTS